MGAIPRETLLRHTTKAKDITKVKGRQLPTTPEHPNTSSNKATVSRATVSKAMGSKATARISNTTSATPTTALKKMARPASAACWVP